MLLLQLRLLLLLLRRLCLLCALLQQLAYGLEPKPGGAEQLLLLLRLRRRRRRLLMRLRLLLVSCGRHCRGRGSTACLPPPCLQLQLVLLNRCLLRHHRQPVHYRRGREGGAGVAQHPCRYMALKR